MLALGSHHSGVHDLHTVEWPQSKASRISSPVPCPGHPVIPLCLCQQVAPGEAGGTSLLQDFSCTGLREGINRIEGFFLGLPGSCDDSCDPAIPCSWPSRKVAWGHFCSSLFSKPCEWDSREPALPPKKGWVRMWQQHNCCLH